MTKRWIVATLAALVACVSASGASAFQFTFGGTVTSAVNGNNVDSSDLVGQRISIVVSGGGSLYQVGSPETDLYAGFSGAQISVGSTTTNYRSIYFEPSYIRNDGSTSSLSFNFGDTFVAFGPLNGFDGNIDINASSSRPDVPLNPEQSFGPIGIQGSGKLSATAYSTPEQDPPGGFVISFNVDTLSGVGSISAVPLPASASLFGAALLALGGVGYGIARRKVFAT